MRKEWKREKGIQGREIGLQLWTPIESVDSVYILHESFYTQNYKCAIVWNHMNECIKQSVSEGDRKDWFVYK